VIVLDTHVLAWADSDERKLGRKARALINRMWNRGEVAVCAMSFWEVAMLQARGRIELPATADEWRGQLLSAGLVELPVDGAIGIRAAALGEVPNDPVDRLVIASALHHGAALMTADQRLLDWNHPLVRHDARQ
jgi:PIN domain nuclease of toxin-antitoxin system